MKIFVSHAMKDSILLKNIENILKPYGLTLLIAEHYFKLQSTISDKIRIMINDCNIGLVLLTANGFNSGFVREEIGYLDAMEKPIVLVIEKGLEKKYSGFKFGHDYILFDPINPNLAVDKIKEIILDHWNKLQEEENKRLQLAMDEQARINRNGLIAIGILAGLLILGSS